MPQHTITLTNLQELALLSELEEMNLQRSLQAPPLPALTLDEMAESIVVADLKNSITRLDIRLPVSIKLLKSLTAPQQTALLNSLEIRPSQKLRLQQLLV